MKDWIYMVLGTFFFAFSVAIFATPNSLAEGGVPGASILLYFSFGWSPALVNFIANSTIFFISYRYLSKSIILKSVIAIPLFSIFLFFLEDLASPLGDPLLAALYAGVFTGIGFGFIFRSGSTIGGTSTIAKVLNYKFGWEITATNFVLDALVVVSGIFVIGPVLALTTVVDLFIGKMVTAYVLEGFETKKIIHIFSKYNESIAYSIRENLGAHTTILQGKNDGDGNDDNLIYVVIPRQRLFYLKKLIREIDEDAFTVVNTVKDVSGGSFAKAYDPNQKMFSSTQEEKRYYKNKAHADEGS